MSPKTAEPKTRNRRTPDQIVADLEAKIADVKARAEAKTAAKEVKGSPDGHAFLATVKAADRAIRVATDERNEVMVRALEAARAPLTEHLIEMGVRLPDPRARKARRAKKIHVA